MFDLHLSNFTDFGPILVELHFFWTYICRTSLMLALHLSNVTYLGPTSCFGPTFAELHLFWTYISRTSLIWDLYFRTYLFCRYHYWIMTCFLLGSRLDHPNHHHHGGERKRAEDGTSGEQVWNKTKFSRVYNPLATL